MTEIFHLFAHSPSVSPGLDRATWNLKSSQKQRPKDLSALSTAAPKMYSIRRFVGNKSGTSTQVLRYGEMPLNWNHKHLPWLSALQTNVSYFNYKVYKLSFSTKLTQERESREIREIRKERREGIASEPVNKSKKRKKKQGL